MKKEIVLMGKQVKKYDEEFKKQTVQYLIEEEKSISQVARELGIGTSTLFEWKKKYSPDSMVTTKPSDVASTEQRQLRESQKRIRDLEEEIAILKKAVAIFTKSPR
jgi:transposase